MKNINLKQKMPSQDSEKTLEEQRIFLQFHHFVKNTNGAFDILNLERKQYEILFALFEAGYYYGKDTGHVEPIDKSTLTNTEASFNSGLTKEELTERNMFLENDDE